MAIAFESEYESVSGSSANPAIPNVNVTGDDRFLVYALLLENTSQTCSGVNLDDGGGGSAQAFTQIGTAVDVEASNFRIYFWGLKAPSTSSNRRIIATLSGSDNYQSGATNYTGVDQTTPTTDTQQGTDASSPGSQLNTSNLNGSWQLGIANNPYNNMVLTAGGVDRTQVGTAAKVGWIQDSNAGINSGSTNTFSWTFDTKMGWITCMMRPSAAAAAGSTPRRRMMVGMGS